MKNKFKIHPTNEFVMSSIIFENNSVIEWDHRVNPPKCIVMEYLEKMQDALYPNTIDVSDKIKKGIFPEDTRTENEITLDFVNSIINRK